MCYKNEFHLEFGDDLTIESDDDIVDALMLENSWWKYINFYGPFYPEFDGSQVMNIQFTQIYKGRVSYQTCVQLNIPYVFRADVKCYDTNKRWCTYGELWHVTGHARFKVYGRL